MKPLIILVRDVKETGELIIDPHGLQLIVDEAYTAGLEDRKKPETDKTISSHCCDCKYCECPVTTLPCSECSLSHKSYFEPAAFFDKGDSKP